MRGRIRLTSLLHDYPQTKLFRLVKVWRTLSGGETIHPGGCSAAAWSGDGVNGMTTPTTMWKRLTRRLGRDGNPLRRRSDVVDAWLVPVAIVVFLALCPLILALIGNWTRAANASEQHAQASWHHVQAVLLQSVPGAEQANHGMNSWIAWAPARWTEDGIQHTGTFRHAPARGRAQSSPCGSTATGRAHVPPLTPGGPAAASRGAADWTRRPRRGARAHDSCSLAAS